MVENFLKHATEYYRGLFRDTQGNAFQLDEDLWEEGEKMSNDDNHDIARPFSELEIKNALFQMETNKAAGPDSIPVEFY
jgi:hypothetical protein